MTLAALIRRRGAGSLATAIPAIPATPQGIATGTVARIATIAVATATTQEGDQWQELESLLAIVGPTYRTPEHEYADMRAAARGDLDCALVAYRELARQVDASG